MSYDYVETPRHPIHSFRNKVGCQSWVNLTLVNLTFVIAWMLFARQIFRPIQIRQGIYLDNMVSWLFIWMDLN
jgi:hypothetical protein